MRVRSVCCQLRGFESLGFDQDRGEATSPPVPSAPVCMESFLVFLDLLFPALGISLRQVMSLGRQSAFRPWDGDVSWSARTWTYCGGDLVLTDCLGGRFVIACPIGYHGGVSSPAPQACMPSKRAVFRAIALETLIGPYTLFSSKAARDTVPCLSMFAY